jgi:hypothetical protein
VDAGSEIGKGDAKPYALHHRRASGPLRRLSDGLYRLLVETGEGLGDKASDWFRIKVLKVKAWSFEAVYEALFCRTMRKVEKC